MCCLKSWITLALLGSNLGFFESVFGAMHELREYCEGETFRAKCAYDEVVLMQRAIYGRMRLGRCIKIDMGYIGCEKEVLDLADNRCSGRRECEISVPDNTFESTQPCLELKSYLEASYTCIKVLPVDTDVCRRSKFIKANAQQGYIASVTSQETWCGGSETPWLIEALPGQRVNLTLLDFGVQRRYHDAQPKFTSTFDSIEVCQKYAVIKEQTPSRSSVVCGGRQRYHNIYLSNSNVVEIQMENRRNNPHYFLLKYEIIGCPDPEVTSATWFKRENNEITLGCKGSDDTWKMTCVGTIWQGEMANCSQFQTVSSEIRMSRTGLPSTLVIATVCGIAFIVGIIVLLLGILLYRRYRRHADDMPPVSPKSTEESDMGDEELYLKPSNGTETGIHHKTAHNKHKDGQYAHTEIQYQRPEGPYQRQEGIYARPVGEIPKSEGQYQRGTIVAEGQYQIGEMGKNEYTHIWEMPLPTPGE